MDDARSQEELDKIFSEIGKFIVFFQCLEDTIFEIIRLPHLDRLASFNSIKLSNKVYAEKLKIMEFEIFNNKGFLRFNTRRDSVIDFKELLKQLLSIGIFRNMIVHQSYLLKFSDYGLPPISLYYDKKGNETSSIVSSKELGLKVAELAGLIFRTKQLHIQLIHDLGASIDPED